MSKTKESMSDQEIWNEVRSVAFNRDFEREIKEFVNLLQHPLYDPYIEEKFKELFLVRN